MFGVDRPRGILSRSDRRYLVGESEIEEKSQQERNARARIRERVREGILDFGYLADPECLEDRDLRQLLTTPHDDGGRRTELAARRGNDATNREPVLDETVEAGLVELIAFVFRVNPSQEYFEQLIYQGVELALNRIREDAVIVDVVQVPIEDHDVIADRVGQLIDEGIPLSDTEIRVALEQEVRPAEEVAEHVQEHGTTDLPVGIRKQRSNLRELLFPDDTTPEERIEAAEKWFAENDQIYDID